MGINLFNKMLQIHITVKMFFNSHGTPMLYTCYFVCRRLMGVSLSHPIDFFLRLCAKIDYFKMIFMRKYNTGQPYCSFRKFTSKKILSL